MSGIGASARSVSSTGCSEPGIARAAGAAARAWQDAPVGCSGSSDEVAAIVRLLAALASEAAAPERTETGYALRLSASPKLEQLANEFISRDSACCPFLEFRLDRDGRDLRLVVSGPEDAQRALDRSFELCRVAQGT